MHTKYLIYSLLLGLASCSMPQDKNVEAVLKSDDSSSLQTTRQYTATAADDSTGSDDLALPEAPRVKRPKGIYQTHLPFGHGMEQTIAFYNDQTFRLQEKYLGKKDSVVITKGNWSPSDGSIWLYTDQVVRGRYRWDGDTLQYISPSFKKNFSMRALQPAGDDAGWQSTSGESLVLYGVGTEPFWHLTFTDRDTLSFTLPAKDQPAQFRLAATQRSGDSIAYTARSDSSELRVTVYPEFCGDGMSDLVYRHRIRVEYNNQVYNGCGILYRQKP